MSSRVMRQAGSGFPVVQSPVSRSGGQIAVDQINRETLREPDFSERSQSLSANEPVVFEDKAHSLIVHDPNPVLADAIIGLLHSNRNLAEYRMDVISDNTFFDVVDNPPNIILTDPWLIGGPRDGVPAQFSALAQSTSVIGYCSAMSADEARTLSLTGFKALVPKTVVGQDLVRVVCAVAFGGSYFHDSYADRAEESAAVPDATAGLTAREIEVLRRVALGSSMKEIACVLNISAKSADTYKTRAGRKLGLRSRSDIVRYAIQVGWMM